MKGYLPFFILLCLFNIQSVVAQTTLPDFGYYSNEEIMMKECSFDKEAEAVVLLDEAYSYYDDNYRLITDRRVRIKILNQRGLDRGNIKIRFYSKNNFELIRGIEAMTYNPDGSSPVSSISRKSIYTEKVDDHFSNVKFALPNVKAGSIIEYKYQSIMKHYGGLDKWIFQSDIPTLKSCFQLVILPNAEFSYVVSKKSNYYVTITPNPSEGKIYFEMNNIPGLRFEPYMDAVKDHLQKVEFQFSGYTNSFGDKENVNATWKEVAYNLSTDEYLGKAVQKNLPIPDDLKALVAKETSGIGKINVIYSYVKDNFTWNGYTGKFAVDGLKKIWEKRTGNAGELNLVLVNLLQAFEIDASPILVAERDFGKVEPSSYPFIDWFNKTAAYVVADGKILILDATQKYCPATLTPYQILNTFALVINKKTEKLLQIPGNEGAYRSNLLVKAGLDNNGFLKGSCDITSYDYAKESQVEGIKENRNKFIVKTYEEPYDGLKVDSFGYEYNKVDTAPLVQHFNFFRQLDETGGFILFNYNLFTGFAKNPFIADERFTDISFGYPFHWEIEEIIELPAKSKTDDLLKDQTLEIRGGTIILSREIKRMGNQLKIKISFRQTLTLIDADAYPTLKNFYKSMIDMLNEPIVIKLQK